MKRLMQFYLRDPLKNILPAAICKLWLQIFHSSSPYRYLIRLRRWFKIFAQSLQISQRNSVFQRVLRHRKFLIAIMAIAAAAAVIYFPGTASAAGEAAADAADTDTGSLLRSINEGFNTVLRISSAWLWPVLMMTGSLLDNDLIFGGAMGERLLSVWVQVRNLVNVVFVLILLGIALYNVLGLGEEGGLPLEFKKAIPKFVLALIAVNFSFLAAKVVLDFSNVITGAVFAMPAATVEESSLNDMMEKSYCGTNSEEAPLRIHFCDTSTNKFNEKAQAFFSRLDRSNITLVYATRFGKAINLKYIRGGIKDIGQLAFNIIFNAVLYVVYAISFIVLFLVLLIRIVALWVGVVLSPVMALGIVLPSLKEFAGGGGGIKDKIVNDIIMPIKIGFVLTIGYIMMDGLQAYKGVHSAVLSATSITSVDPNSLPTDITDLQQLMVAVAMVVVVWMGVFMGTEKATAGFLTSKIKSYAESAGGFIGKLPMYAQILPVGEKRGGRLNIPQWIDSLRLTRERFMEKYAYAPERGGDLKILSSLVSQGNYKGYAEKIGAGTGNPFATEPELDLLRQIARKSGDTKFADALAKLNVSQKDRIADAIIVGEGQLAAELRRQMGGSAAGVKARINSAPATTVPETKADAKTPPVPTSTAVAAGAGTPPPGPGTAAPAPGAATTPAPGAAGGGAAGATATPAPGTAGTPAPGTTGAPGAAGTTTPPGTP